MMMTSFQTIFLGFLLLSLGGLSSCRKGSSDKEKRDLLHKKLTFGRRVLSPTGLESPVLLLTGDSTIKQEIDDNGNLLRVLFDTRKMPEISKEKIQPWTRNWISEHSDTLGVQWNDLTPAKRPILNPDQHNLSIEFTRNVNGIPVRDAGIIFHFVTLNPGSERYKLASVHNFTWGSIEISNQPETMPVISQFFEESGYQQLSAISSRDVIFPRKVHNQKVEFLHAREFILKGPGVGLQWTLTLSAKIINDSRILEIYANRHSHSIYAKTFETSFLDQEKQLMPLSFLSLPQGYSTDGDGVSDIPDTGNIQAFTLTGPRAVVQNGANTNSPQEAQDISLTGTINGTQTIVEGENSIEISGLMTYTALLKINRLVRRHLSPSEASILNAPIPAFVDVNTQGTCNAFYAPGDNNYMVFFQEGGGCANTGQMTDVVAHEWCHGLDDKTGQPGISDAAFSEGIGDLCAGFLSQAPEMARGFFLNEPNRAMRSLKNTFKYPENQSQDPHLEGLIPAGAIWDMKENLEKKYGKNFGTFKAERLFFRSLVTTNRYLDLYANVLLLNDDDANPATPSPDFCEINQAFSAHGLAEAEIDCQKSAPILPDNYKVNTNIFLAAEAAESQKNPDKWVVSVTEGAVAHLCFQEPMTCIENNELTTKMKRVGLARILLIFLKPRLQKINSKQVQLSPFSFANIMAKKNTIASYLLRNELISDKI